MMKIPRAWTPVTFAASRKQFAAHGLAPFILHMMPSYMMGWVHREICIELDRFLQSVVEKRSPRLMITMPPRHGKSQIASRMFPAYALGRYPDMSFIAASYSAELSSRMNRDVQRIIDNSRYREIFPQTVLPGPKAGIRTSDLFEIAGRSGVYRSSGVGGSITGMGAECVLVGTQVATPDGNRSVENLQIGDNVLSYNHITGEIEIDTVTASKDRYAEESYRLCDTFGRILDVTGNHPIFSRGKYTSASSVATGDSILCLVRSGVCETCLYGDQTHRLARHERRTVQTGCIAKTTRVYGATRRFIDIQVERNQNFFANGFLVHNCAIIDDPFKDRASADSLTLRDKLWDWYTSTLYTRLAPGGGIIIINTRWHMDDLSGRLLAAEAAGEGDSWRVVNFPAVAEHDEPYRKTGEALHPERYPLEQLLRIKAAVGMRDWAALYQQHPVPDGGAIFRQEWFRYWEPKDIRQRFDSMLMSWDMAFKESDTSDFVVGQVWGKIGASFFLLDQVRGRWSFTETVNQFVRLADKWPMVTRKLVEDKANGPAVIDTLRTRISGIVPVKPDGSKTARAYAVTPLFEAGNVFLPLPDIHPWAKELTRELLQFPSVAHDDQVDALTQALNGMNGGVVSSMDLS